ncbi:hypothetical protein PQI07_28095 [Methylobacterium sp. 092160098-2]|uniref:hypothetical protein n=1 Tax=Methylobacterium sp. 092160098-2 TaxID=3025129 RepID=UPI002381B3B4|nr:hypothetical protein [Methylobacterium sp. 092160098-2]MDE4914531.1 hypothetical protein [Methylobacterium sp. 092160098-2]
MGARENIAAATLGLLVGCMLGFSSQSEIAGAVAGVLTLATGLIGVAQPSFLGPSPSGDRNTRMIWFGGTATAAFLLTYALAVQHVLEPSVASRLKELTDAGYEEPVAKAMIARHFYEVDVDGWQKLTAKPEGR